MDFLFGLSIINIIIGHLFITTAHGMESSFDPFMDSNLFYINWAGPLAMNNEEINALADRHVVITTNHHEKYQCILPDTDNKHDDDEASYTGPEAIDLLKPLMTSVHCSYRIESYWTYELCHGKHLKQYHESKDTGTTGKVTEYFLGSGNSWEEMTEEERVQALDPAAPLPKRELDGVELPYVEVVMEGGTICDLTGKPRRAHVLYVCQVEGRGEIYEFKESSTCEYEVVVLTSTLCTHPRFRPKTAPVSEIRCHAMPGSATKPKELYRVNMEANTLLQGSQQRQPRIIRKAKPSDSPIDEPEAAKPDTPTPTREVPATGNGAPPMNAPPSNPQPKLSSFTDKQTLRGLLTGTQCLPGGQGWWKHEVCFGRYAKQFHVERGTGVTTNIFLGYWDEEAHIKWLNDNPLKKPKAPAERTSMSLMYTNGDMCDLTKKPRTCEVRLKCIQNSKNPHAVLVSLQEPTPCQYAITVESSILCASIKEADENGLMDIEEMEELIDRHDSTQLRNIYKKRMNMQPNSQNIKDPNRNTYKKLTAPPIHKQHNTRTFKQSNTPDQNVPTHKQPNTQGHNQHETPQEPNKLIFRKKVPPPPRQPPVKAKPPVKLSHFVDKQLMKAFVQGAHCLSGGDGWWKNEVCLGSFAKQYHVDKHTGAKTNVYLGYWNEDEHTQWLKGNPLMRPKPPMDREWVSLLYTNGDVCDITNTRRTCEVRLTCIPDKMVNKNGKVVLVSLHLQEPSPCQYVLIVESAFFCPVIKEADENGLVDGLDFGPDK